MTAHSFPALGFDPAPGDPDALEDLAVLCGSFADELFDDARRAAALSSGFVWSGRAADAFERRLTHVPRDLERAGSAHSAAGGALRTFSEQLREHQQRARALEQQADAQCTISSAPSTLPEFLSPAAQAHVELNRIRAQAHSLRDTVLVDALHCNRLLLEATRHAPKPPGLLSRIGGGLKDLAGALNKRLGDFVRDNAGFIAGLSAICSQLASALAVVAMVVGPIPVLGEAVGGVAFWGAMVTGGVALLGHALLHAYAQGRLAPVVFDTVALSAGAVGHVLPLAASGTAAEAGSSGLRANLATLRHPGAALAEGATAEMAWERLLVRTAAFQFDAVAGSMGTYDLARTLPVLRAEVVEAQHKADEETERLRASSLSGTSELGFTRFIPDIVPTRRGDPGA